MGWWSEQVVPRVTHVALDTRAVRAVRRRAVATAHGEVVELGFGSGPTLAVYPPAVTSVLAVEPSPVARRLAARAVTGSRIPVRWVGLDGEHVPLPDHCADTVVSTFSLCTIDDPGAALAEARRLLRPGGVLLFCEHGLAPEPRTARRQRRLDGLQQRVFAGCHLARPIDDLVRAAGFTVTTQTHERLRRSGALSFLFVGTARP